MRNSEVIGMLSHESNEHRPDASESLAATQLSVLTGVIEARVKIGAWREEYNEELPHSSLGNLTGSQFKVAFWAKSACADV